MRTVNEGEHDDIDFASSQVSANRRTGYDSGIDSDAVAEVSSEERGTNFPLFAGTMDVGLSLLNSSEQSTSSDAQQASGNGGNDIQVDGDRVLVYPRKKQGQERMGSDRPPVIVTRDFLTTHFHEPLTSVAKDLNLSATVLKKLCRKLGIEKWPYKRQKALPQHHPPALASESRQEHLSDPSTSSGPAESSRSSTDKTSSHSSSPSSFSEAQTPLLNATHPCWSATNVSSLSPSSALPPSPSRRPHPCPVVPARHRPFPTVGVAFPAPHLHHPSQGPSQPTLDQHGRSEPLHVQWHDAGGPMLSPSYPQAAFVFAAPAVHGTSPCTSSHPPPRHPPSIHAHALQHPLAQHPDHAALPNSPRRAGASRASSIRLPAEAGRDGDAGRCSRSGGDRFTRVSSGSQEADEYGDARERTDDAIRLAVRVAARRGLEEGRDGDAGRCSRSGGDQFTRVSSGSQEADEYGDARERTNDAIRLAVRVAARRGLEDPR